MKRLDDQWQQKKCSTFTHLPLKNQTTCNVIKTSGKSVDQNVDGIKQSRGANPTAGDVVNSASGGGKDVQTGRTRYLGRMAITSSKIAHRKAVPTRLKVSEGIIHAENFTAQRTSNPAIIPSPKTQNISFGTECDEELLCVMDKLERDYVLKTAHIKLGDGYQVHFTNGKNQSETVPIVARVEVDLPNISSVVQSHIDQSNQPVPAKSIDASNGHTHFASKNCKKQSNACKKPENLKFTAVTLATPTHLVTEIVEGHPGDNAELDFSSTWETPLHVSTPTNGNNGKGKKRPSHCSPKTNNTQAIFDTPKSLSTKPREMIKLFQAILNSDNENDIDLHTNQLKNNESKFEQGFIKVHNHSSSTSDNPAISSAASHKNQHLPEQEKVETKHNAIEHQSPDTSSADDRLLLSSWGLPETILDSYQAHGITRMFEWQAECLCTGNALARGNLIYAAPTSAGKTMVAELLMLKCVLETKKKALFILPFVSVAREKVSYLQDLFKDAGVHVDGYFGHTSPAGGFSSVDIAICTIEKANNLVNRLLEDKAVEQLGIVVVDELHMVGDSNRGYLLELLLTKLRFVISQLTAKEQFRKVDSLSSPLPNPIQIVGMSATLPNLDLLAHWLNADLYRTDFRPVPLTEMVKIGLDIYDSMLNKLRSLSIDQTLKNDEDHIIPLCLETIGEGCSVLIFCPTKNWCEKLADTIAREFFRVLLQPSKQTGFIKASELTSGPLNQTKLRDVVEQLRRTPFGLDSMLGKMIPCGVAFHHAGLTFDERDIVEGAFRLGALKVLVATSTLSSGVNLPARRVIVRTPVFHGAVVDTRSYRQMIGRAGRKGVDTQGESILVCKASERHMAHSLLTSELPPVSSCLFPSSSGSLTSSMKRAILEIVVSKVASTPDEVDLYARCTLLSAEVEMDTSQSSTPNADKASKIDSIQLCIDYLREHEFIMLTPGVSSDGISTSVFTPTQLGSAVVASGLSPDEGLVVFGELQKARRCFVLENELHTVYLVTPVYMQDQWATLDWYKYLCLWEQLPQDMKRVAELVGVQERFLARAAGGRVPCETAQQARVLATHKRFYSAVILHDLVNEMPLSTAVRKYGCTRGILQSMQQSASTFAGMVTVFCSKLGWSNLEMLLSQFQSRLSFGVQPELVDLVRISLLNGQRARIVYNGGYATVAMVAAAEPAAIEKILHTASPFLSKKKADDEMDWELEERLKSRCIWATGQKGLTECEAAVLIVDEAKKLLKDDLQQMGVEWKPALKPDKEKEKDTSRNQHIFYKRRKTTNKENKNSLKKHENVGLEISGSAVSNNRSVLTPPTSMRRLTQQHTMLKRDNLITSCTADRSKSRCADAPVMPEAWSEPDPQPANMQHISEDAKGVLLPVLSNIADNVDTAVSRAYQNSRAIDSNQSSQLQSDSVVAVDEAMLILSDSNASLMDWCPNKTLESSVNEILNVPCIVENIKQALVSREEHSHFDADVHPDHSALDTARKSMEISDTSLMLDTQTLEMITDATNADRYFSKVQNQGIVTSDSNQANSAIKGVACASTADTPLLFSEDHDVCQFVSSFLTQKPIDIKPTGCDELQRTRTAHSEIHSETKHAVNLSSVVSDMSTGCDTDEQHVEPTFTNLVPLSNYERERFSGEGRFSGILFENENSQGDDTVVRNIPDGFLQAANDIILTPKKSSVISVEAKAEMSGDNIFCHSDAVHLADVIHNSKNQELETRAFTRVHKNTEKCLNVETEKSKAPVFLTNSLTTSIIAKVLADSEIQMSTQNDSFFGCNDWAPVMIETGKKLNESKREQQEDKSSEQVEGNTVKHTIQINVQLDHTARNLAPLNQEQNLSPEMESLMNALCGSQTGRLPEISSKRTKSGLKTKNNESQWTAEKKPKRIRQSSSILEEEKDIEENYHENSSKNDVNQMSRISSGSDSSACIPPTPPSFAEDASKTSTPKRLLGGVVGTPKKSDSAPALALKLGKSKNNQLNMASNFIPSSPSLSSNQVPIPGRCNISKDVTEILQQNCNVNDDSRLISMTQSFTVIDVASNRLLFENFIQEWRCKKSFSLSMACERYVAPQCSRSKAIGSKFTAAHKRTSYVTTGLHMEGSDLTVVGVAISWENCDAYYVSFVTSDSNCCDLDSSLAASPLDEGLSVTERLESVRSVLEEGKSRTVTIYDLKEQYKLLCSFCGIVPCAQFADVKVACWLMDPDVKAKNLHCMVTNYCPSMSRVLDGTGCGCGIESLGLTVNNSTNSGRIRASTEAVVVNHLMNALTNVLGKSDLLRCFTHVEMPTVEILAKMELNGMGFSEAECDVQRSIMQAKMEALEESAYRLAGHPFSLTSTDDISHVLFVELHLPLTGDPMAPNPIKTLGTTNRGKASRGRLKQSFSTSKDILEKLKKLHPLPGLLLEWRRISSALTKVVFPLQKEKSYNAHLDMYRIYGKSDFQTSTGRVTMHEPNLQNIPKDFEIHMPGVAGESPAEDSTDGSTSRPVTRGHRGRAGNVTRKVVKDVLASVSGPSYSVSMRNSVIPFKGGILLAADYSQLELRIIAHLSNDRKLIEVLNGGEDVFKAIASQLKMVDVESVTTEQRQQAKQVCYGMIYGIGPPALAEQLGVSENDASVFIETFKDKYPGMRRFLHETVKACRDKGYVQMISGRVRHLPAIKDTNPHSRAHAERQAVNSTVQGSAADLVKTAMIRIDRELAKNFPETVKTHRHLRNNSEGRTRSKVCPPASKVRGAYFILQLHDELIYEVHQSDFKQVARIIKENMENAMKLSVKLPVKLKAGPSWGCMQDIVL